jgi:hypothetical protein
MQFTKKTKFFEKNAFLATFSCLSQPRSFLDFFAETKLNRFENDIFMTNFSCSIE